MNILHIANLLKMKYKTIDLRTNKVFCLLASDSDLIVDSGSVPLISARSPVYSSPAFPH